MKSIRYSRVIPRLLVFIVFATLFVIRGFYIHWTVRDPKNRKIKFARTNRWVQDLCCRTFGVQIRLINEPPQNAKGLFVGNHLGFLDILCIGGSRPLLFITSQEMRETPVLGLLTEMASCIYVERRSRKTIHDELKNIVGALKEGHSVVLFPEATSHNGEAVLPFKRTLLSSAAHANVPIYPYTINFVEIDGEPFSTKNRDFVCWYGDIPFVKSMFAAFSLKKVCAEIKFHPPFTYTLDMDRAVVADQIHDIIAKDFHPVKSVT